MGKMSNYTFVDLFAGAGGASCGFEKAGLKSVGAVEIDDWAADTYEFNHPHVKVLRTDITNLSNNDLKKFKGADVVVGGPPCQGFSIAASNRRKKHDPRNNYYLEYVRAIEQIKPKAFLVENVKEIVKYRLEDGTLLLDDFCSRLERAGYKISHNLINAQGLGVPQERIRFFMMGFRDKVVEIDEESLLGRKRKIQLSLDDAISDLPTPVVGMDTVEYSEKAKNKYQRTLRKESKMVFNHEPMRHTQRVIERFKLIPIKGNMLDVPDEHRTRKRGDVSRLSGKVYHQNHRRLDPDKPCKTITASFYSSFVHPYQHRNITVREAARVQGFPDTFRFMGKRTTLSKKLLAKKGIHEDLHLDQFNQVGNAVSPIVAEILGRR